MTNLPLSRDHIRRELERAYLAALTSSLKAGYSLAVAREVAQEAKLAAFAATIEKVAGHA